MEFQPWPVETEIFVRRYLYGVEERERVTCRTVCMESRFEGSQQDQFLPARENPISGVRWELTKHNGRFAKGVILFRRHSG